MSGAGPDGYRVRPMERADVPEVAKIESERYRTDAWSETAFHDALDRPDRYRCLVVGGADGHAGSEVIGYGVVSIAGDTADLDNLTVRSGQERRGLGRILLGELLQCAADAGAAEIWLEVRVDNRAAILLYEQSGFVEVARRRGYYAAGIDAIVMSRAMTEPIRATGETRRIGG